MKAKNIVITESDYGRLQRLMNRLGIVVVSTLRTLTHLSKNWRVQRSCQRPTYQMMS